MGFNLTIREDRDLVKKVPKITISQFSDLANMKKIFKALRKVELAREFKPVDIADVCKVAAWFVGAKTPYTQSSTKVHGVGQIVFEGETLVITDTFGSDKIFGLQSYTEKEQKVLKQILMQTVKDRDNARQEAFVLNIAKNEPVFSAKAKERVFVQKHYEVVLVVNYNNDNKPSYVSELASFGGVNSYKQSNTPKGSAESKLYTTLEGADNFVTSNLLLFCFVDIATMHTLVGVVDRLSKTTQSDLVLPKDVAPLYSQLGGRLDRPTQEWQYELLNELIHTVILRDGYNLKSLGSKVDAPEALLRSTEVRGDTVRFTNLHDLNTFMCSYFDDVIAYKQLVEYEEQQEKLGRIAGVWDEKKNIPNWVNELRETSPLLVSNGGYVNHLDIDESVEVERFKVLEHELLVLHNTLTQRFLNGSLQGLHVRKLGKHKATGLYSPMLNSIAIDVRDTNSYIHEFGHLLDYNLGAAKGLYTLSVAPDFREIRELYTKHLRDNGGVEEFGAKLSYYLTPTEIFARMFEAFYTKYVNIQDFVKPLEFKESRDQLNGVSTTLLQELGLDKVAMEVTENLAHSPVHECYYIDDVIMDKVDNYFFNLFHLVKWNLNN